MFPPDLRNEPCRPVNDESIQNIMGDKSPKSVQKKSNQKQSKTNSANQKKQQATAAKQAPSKGR